MTLYLGVDFASVDGNKPIDWTKAKAAGCRFAIIRGTYINWIDPAWAAESKRALAAGMRIGPYMFPSLAIGAPSPAEQVAVLKRAVGGLGPGFFPPTLDVEFPGGIQRTGRTRRQLLELVLMFVAEMRAAWGVAPMIYTSGRVMDGEDADSLNADASGLDLTELWACPLWLARYPYNYRLPAVGDDAGEKPIVEKLPLPPVPKAWGDATNVFIHQYQGDARGFGGVFQVDMNRFFELREGAKGERVRWLQKRLGMAEGTPGVFDAVTTAAVKAFQRAELLGDDGIVGPATFSFAAWRNP